jgi:hypothetical protein
LAGIYIDYRELELLLQEECSYFRVFSPRSCLVAYDLWSGREKKTRDRKISLIPLNIFKG